jgi:hypothetical protein
MTHAHGHDMTVSVDITDAVDRLAAMGALDMGGAVKLTVVAADRDGVPIERNGRAVEGA